MITEYIVKKVDRPLCGTVVVPGSKSMTNRALLLAALSEEKSVLEGVLFSDDSRHFLQCLISLGYDVKIDEQEAKVEIAGCGRNIPLKNGTINVGSAGTAARFLTAMLALSDGEYVIECSEQMEKRPMEELFRVLSEMGATFEYLKESGHLPVRVKGNSGTCKNITMDISKSTQFLSAMLMVTPVTESGIRIKISSEKKTGAYINITTSMLAEFGVQVDFDGEEYIVKGGQKICINNYYIEPDVSAACYFYGAAAITGGSVTVKNVFYSSMQGDMKFLKLLEKMGCTLTETSEGICLKGQPQGAINGVDVDMNDFSDQALTLAAIAPYANGDVIIRNVGHIRGQECNRMAAIVNELNRVGIECFEQGDDIFIKPGKVLPSRIETYDDHRVAMAMSLLGLKAEGIVIDNPMCCRKTFEKYFEVFERFTQGD